MSSKKKPAVKGASRPSKKAPKAPIIKETIQAPHVFLPDEVSVLNVNLREHLDQIETLEGEAKAAAQDFKLRITNHKNEVIMLRKKLSSGQETRSLEATVTFDPKKRIKTYFHPETKAEIRHEPMTEVDWQLPMFKPAPDGKGEVVAKKGEQDVPAKGIEKPKGEKAKTAKEKAGKDKVIEKEPVVGETPVGAALNQAASLTEAPKVPYDMEHAKTLDHVTLARHFIKEAKRVGWNQVQIGLLKDLFSQCATEEQYLEVIRPHTSDPTAQ